MVRDGVDDVSALGNAGLADVFVGPCVLLLLARGATGLHIRKHLCNLCVPRSSSLQLTAVHLHGSAG